MHRGLLFGILTLVSTGCAAAGWQRVDIVPATAIAPRQVVQIWHGGQDEEWHGVQFTEDSVIGVPYIKRLDCDSCRMALPRAAVDSVRYGDPVTPGIAIALAPLGALLLFGIVFAVESHGD